MCLAALLYQIWYSTMIGVAGGGGGNEPIQHSNHTFCREQWFIVILTNILLVLELDKCLLIVDRLCRAGPRGRKTLGVHPLSWLLSNNRLEKVPFVSVPHISSNQLLLSNQDKGCTPSVAHSLALPLGPALHNLCTVIQHYEVFCKQHHLQSFP